MTARELPGQLALPLNEPFLTDEVRAELATHVVDGWQLMGQCRSVADDTWFPEDSQSDRTAALAACHACPVRVSCLVSALLNDEEHGIWGGISEWSRSVARRELSDGIPVNDVLADPTYLVFMQEAAARVERRAA